MHTPEIIFCSDPPNYNRSTDIILGDILAWKPNAGIGYDYVKRANVTIKKIQTLLKVTFWFIN